MEIHQHLESLYPADSRFEEIEKILSFVKEGNSCQMIGMPGVGRGNICKFLAYNRNIRIKHLGNSQTSYHFIFVNFAEIKNRPLFDAMKFIFLELVSSLHERLFEDAFEKTDKIFKESLSYQDELVLFQGLKDAIDYLAHEKNLTICFLFERFETYIPQLTDDFFTHLRSLRDHAKYKFSVVFSITRPLEELVEPTMLADFYEFFVGRTVYLPIEDSPGIHFRITYLEKLTKKSLGETCIKDLLSLTSGHGKLTRLSCEALLANTKEITSQQDLQTYLLKEKTIQGALTELWQFLTPSEQECVESIILKKPCTFSPFLESVYIIVNNKISIPLFVPFILKQTENQIQETEHFVYDETTNAIKKGALNISEQLTSSEFRLLKFLIQNAEKVLDREQIITSVWKNTATTEGVTDQALDQLIFRLRKKIEENPNIPLHIQTVKGRGIRFVS